MQTSIAIDHETKTRAAKRAKAEHMPLSVVVRVLLSEYADGHLNIGARLASEISGNLLFLDRSRQNGMAEKLQKIRDRKSATL